MLKDRAQAQRFIRERMVVDENGCWRWISSINAAGYGRCNPGFIGRVVRAHRLAYEAFVGPIPDGLTVDHLCSVRDCVNPDHLEVCTLAVNRSRGHSRDMAARRLLFG